MSKIIIKILKSIAVGLLSSIIAVLALPFFALAFLISLPIDMVSCIWEA